MTMRNAVQPIEPRWSIGNKMILGFLLTVFVPLALIGGGIYLQRESELRTNTETTIQLLAEARAAEIELVADKLEETAENLIINRSDFNVILGSLQPGATAEDIATADAEIDRIFRDNLTIERIRLYDTGLNVISQRTTSTLPVFVDTQRELARSALFTGIVGIYEGDDEARLMDIVVPIRDNEGHMRGHIVLTQNLEEVVAQSADVNTEGIINLNRLSIVKTVTDRTDADTIADLQLFLYNDRGELVAATQNRSAIFSSDFSEAVPLTGDRPGQVVEYDTSVLEEEVLGYYQPVSGTPWTLEVAVPLTEISNPLIFGYMPVAAAVLIGLGVLSLGMYIFLFNSIVPPLKRVIYQMNAFSLQQPHRPIPVSHRDEIGQAQQAFNRMTAYTYETYNKSLEQYRDLNIHLQLLYTINDIIGLQDQEFLLSEIVRLIRQDYEKVDYAQIYLLDDSRTRAILRAGTGELGRRMLVQEHEQALSQGGMVANAILLGDTIVVNDLATNIEYRLPDVFNETKSIVVVPIQAGETVIGVLDIHSFSPNVFGSDDIAFFETIGASLGVTLSSQIDRSSGKSGSSFIDVSTLKRDDLPTLAFGVGTDEKSWTSVQQQAMQRRQLASRDDGATVNFAIPVILRDEVLGAVEWTVDKSRYNNELVQTATDLVTRLGLAIDNARLFEQGQRLVTRERLVNEISQKLTQQNDIRQILQLAVRELGQALGTPETKIKLNIDRRSE